MAHALEVRGLRKSFGSTEVLRDIDIALEEGGFLVLLGPSGCGKSTLLAIVAGLEDASDGTVSIDGRVANNLQPRERDIAMVFQSYALYPSMDVGRNMGFGLKMRGADRATREGKVEEAAGILAIRQLLDRRPADLSGGQRQRVAMGRALVRSPKLFLLDEPLSNLDAKLRAKMRGELKKLHQDLGATFVYVTHDQVEAMTLATEVAVMNGGVIEQVADPLTIYRDPDSLFVAGFIGSPSMNFADGAIASDGRSVVCGADMLPLPASLAGLPPGREVTVGLRPEHLSVGSSMADADGAGLSITPTLVELMGADTLVHFDFGGTEMVARVPGSAAVSLGEPLALACDLSAIQLFDPKTGARIRSPDLEAAA